MSKKKFMLIKVTKEQARRTEELYAPQFESDFEVSKKINPGLEVAGSISSKKKRNVRHHRKYWALIKVVYHNLPESLSDKIKNEYELHIEVKMQAGVRERRESLSGKVYYIPKSISFDKMGQEEFNEFYSKALDICCKWILPGINSHDLENEIMDFL